MRELFIESINNIKKVYRASEELNTVLENNRDVYGDTYVIGSGILESNIVELLNKLLNIPEDDDIISWWLFERDFGEDFEVGDLEIRNEFGDIKAPDLSTVEKLYDYLEETYQK